MLSSSAARPGTKMTLRMLENALSLAEPEGYIRLFVDEGIPMAALLHKAAARGIAPDYANKLLAAFGAGEHEIAPPPLPPSALSPLPMEPLSDRELEVAGLDGHRPFSDHLLSARKK